jgi:hypothetical protein
VVQASVVGDMASITTTAVGAQVRAD